MAVFIRTHQTGHYTSLCQDGVKGDIGFRTIDRDPEGSRMCFDQSSQARQRNPLAHTVSDSRSCRASGGGESGRIRMNDEC